MLPYIIKLRFSSVHSSKWVRRLQIVLASLHPLYIWRLTQFDIVQGCMKIQISSTIIIIDDFIQDESLYSGLITLFLWMSSFPVEVIIPGGMLHSH